MISQFVGRRAQACDGGVCEPITIMTEPQRGPNGDWEVLVIFDARPSYLTPLKVQGYLYLEDPGPPGMTHSLLTTPEQPAQE